MISNAFYGETSEGYWTIKMYDGDSLLATGSLSNWKILINGHMSALEMFNPMPVTGIYLGPVQVTSTNSPLFGFTHSTSLSDLYYYEAAVGTAASNEAIKDWTNIGLTNSANILTGMTLVDGQTYYLKIRAVSPYGFSSVQIKPWTADF
jgi:hypothetical protein